MFNDYEYLYMIRQNDGDAMETMFLKYRSLVWKRSHDFVNQQRPQGVSVEDMFQEGSIGFVDALYSYKEHLNVGLAHYVSICVESNIRTALRKCRGKSFGLLDSRTSLDMAISEDSSLYLGDVIASMDLKGNPVFMSQYYEAEIVMETVLSSMAPHEREIYEMRECGYSYAEIAQSLEISVKTVDNIIQKVRRKLIAASA